MSKRRYTRLAPSLINWSVSKGQSLWLKGMPIREMAKELGISEVAVKRAAMRYGWPKRKEWRKKPPAIPMQVKIRCPDCLGIYEAKITATTTHLECPARRVAA